MTFLTGVLVGCGICICCALFVIYLVRGEHVEEESYADDPRPAILKEQAE